MRSSPEQIRKATVRLVHSSDRSPPRFGTGVFVTGSAVLTARHVVDPAETGMTGEAPKPQWIKVESAAYSGTRVADDVVFPHDPTVDLAIIELHEPKSVPSEFCCQVRSHPLQAVSVGDEVDICGHASIDGDIQIDSMRVLAVHGNAGAFICNKAVPSGYSGGPVFADGALVGVMYARNHGQGQSYFYGGHVLQDLLKTPLLKDVAWTDDVVSPLRRYPLGPGISKGETLYRLDSVINAYSRLYDGPRAISIIARANAARVACGPDSGDKGLIELHHLPNHEPYGFWQQAFVFAGLKSPRMLAALLEAVDAEQLDAKSEKERAAMLRFLSTVGKHP